MTTNKVEVVIDLPAHSQIDGALTYVSESNIARGAVVRVPLGKKQVTGIVWKTTKSLLTQQGQRDGELIYTLKPVEEVLDTLEPLNQHWQDLVSFTAQYYQRSIGEVALQALPPALRKINFQQLQRRLKRLEKTVFEQSNIVKMKELTPSLPELTPEQHYVLDEVTLSLPAVHVQASSAHEISHEGSSKSNAPVFLLQGATGSGKTEVYMRVVQHILQTDASAQALILVPEINLTPQLQERFQQRFPHLMLVSMHSGMTSAQRLQSWLAAHAGHARIVLGTRMAIFASMPKLQVIVVDEEHDPSYKQYEGARWSARDLAVWRGWKAQIPVILGSATPSLESWQHAQQNRYRLLEMPSRVGAGVMPKVRIVNTQHQPKGDVLSPSLAQAIQMRVSQGEQSLILLNRRGYAPVLFCSSCGWQSQCPHCTALRVFHRIDRTVRCHHCGFTQTVPRACPECGDQDLQPIGKGTERLEEQLQQRFVRKDGSVARVLRIDADSTRHAGELVQHLEQIHQGDVDILVGTQMIAKGHDFRRVTLVAAINPDAALFSSDFRSGERLFALLLQAAGRAGRDAHLADHSELWVQTQQPEHPLFDALKNYDFAAFANATLAEREMAAMPPFFHLALMRAEARTQEAAQDFLAQIHDIGINLCREMGVSEYVTLYPPIPAAMQRIANIERAQMMLESSSRQALQRFLAQWRKKLRDVHVRGVVRWAIDVDPQAV